jgi:Activator of Hsp90 ATPase homolog 1-like protein
VTSNQPIGQRIVGTLRTADGTGIVRMADRFDTDIDDLWSAFTEPSRLGRWLGEFEGDLRLGGEFRGIPVNLLAEYGAGNQVHVEDLAAYLAGRERADIETRWNELMPAYRDLAANATWWLRRSWIVTARPREVTIHDHDWPIHRRGLL